MIGWRLPGAVCFVLAACATACATGTGSPGDDSPLVDSGNGVGPDAPSSPPDAATPSRDSAPPPTVDSGPPNPHEDAAPSFDAAALDGNIGDVEVPDAIPDVYVPPGTSVCDYLGSAGDFAKYVGECLLFESIAAPCASGCPSGSCCGALCTNGSDEAVCLPE